MSSRYDTGIKIYTKFSEADARACYRFLDHPKGTYTEIRGINSRKGEVRRFFVQCEDEFVEKCKALDREFNVFVGVNPRNEKIRKF